MKLRKFFVVGLVLVLGAFLVTQSSFALKGETGDSDDAQVEAAKEADTEGKKSPRDPGNNLSGQSRLTDDQIAERLKAGENIDLTGVLRTDLQKGILAATLASLEDLGVDKSVLDSAVTTAGIRAVSDMKILEAGETMVLHSKGESSSFNASEVVSDPNALMSGLAAFGILREHATVDAGMTHFYIATPDERSERKQNLFLINDDMILDPSKQTEFVRIINDEVGPEQQPVILTSAENEADVKTALEEIEGISEEQRNRIQVERFADSQYAALTSIDALKDLGYLDLSQIKSIEDVLKDRSLVRALETAK